MTQYFFLNIILIDINKVKNQTQEKLLSRILVIQLAPDYSPQYIPIMNSVFSAQKMSTIIDSCVLSNFDSPFLQQASFLTGYIYILCSNITYFKYI